MMKSSQPSNATSSQSKLEKIKQIQGVIPSAIAEVNQIIKKHGLLPELEQVKLEPKTTEESIAVIEHIFHRFHRVACTQSERKDVDFVFDVSGEKEVQDLMHGLLRIHFDSVIKEETTEKVADTSSQIDFLMPDSKIGIEVKMGYHGNRELRKQINDDKGLYVAHSRCDILLVYVYDPDYKVRNPVQFERDLSKNISGLDSRVFVLPKP